MSQKGAVQILFLVAALGIVIFIIFAATASFKDRLFSQLFSKPYSRALSGPIPSPQAKLSLIPSAGELHNNCQYDIKIELDTDGGETDGTDAILFFDPNKLTVSSIVEGTLYRNYFQNIDNTNGVVALSGLIGPPPEPTFNGLGIFGTVKFTVKPTASGSAQIRFDFDPANPQKTTDSNVVEHTTVKELLSSVTDGSYTISTGSCKLGDLNGDDFINVVDFSILLSKWGTSDAVADLNKDGVINVVDFSILLSNWGK